MKRPVLAAAVAFLLGLAVAFPLGLKLGGTGRLISVETSPDGKERLELYRPGPLQQLLGYGGDDYAVARLSSIAEASSGAASAPFYDEGAGSTHWSREAVDVGTAARFDRATGRWSVQ